MKNSKHWLRAFGLSIMAALGLMAFTAAAAQAGNGLFTVGGSAAAGQSITGEIKVLGELLVPARNLKIVCHKGQILSATLGHKVGLGNVKFEECLVLDLEGNPISGCEVTNGKTITTLAQVLAVLGKDGNLYALFEPDVGATSLELTALFTNVTFEPGKGCVLPLTNPVRGSVSALVSTGLTSELPLLEFAPAHQTTTGDGLHYGTASSHIVGGATLRTVVGKLAIGVH